MFSRALNSLTRAIEIYIDIPCPATKYQLKNRLRELSFAYSIERKEMEERIAKSVLSHISVEVGESVTKTVNKILDNFERGH